MLSSDIRDTDPTAAERLGEGLHTFEIKIPPRLLAPTTYLLTIHNFIQFTGVIDQHACCEFTLRELASALHQRGDVLGVQLPWDHRIGPLENASAHQNWAGASLAG